MSTTLMNDPEVARYLAAVRANLADLDEPEREDLLAEVETSIRDAAADAPSVEERLGPPEAFAAELRAAAGLAPLKLRRRRPKLADAQVVVRPLLPLAPIWWAVRGYVLIALVGLLGAGWTATHPAIPDIVNGRIGLAATVLVVVASVVAGLRLRRVRWAATAVDVALLVALVPVVFHLAHSRPLTQTLEYPVPTTLPAGLWYDGREIANIYPYSREGTLLHDVLLYDQTGAAIALTPGVADPNRRVLHTANRYAPVYNAYPVRYFDPGTTVVAHPNAGPRVRVPSLAPGP